MEAQAMTGSFRNYRRLWQLVVALGLSWTLFTSPALARDYFIFAEEVWSNRYPANAGYRWPVALDAASRDVFVTGISQVSHGETNHDYVTVKYSSGQENWARFYNGTGNDDDIAAALALTSQHPAPLKPSKKDKWFRPGGHLYVTGTSKGVSGTGTDFLTVKYTTSGNKLWDRRYNTPDNQDEIGAALAVDRHNNVMSPALQAPLALVEGVVTT